MKLKSKWTFKISFEEIRNSCCSLCVSMKCVSLWSQDFLLAFQVAIIAAMCHFMPANQLFEIFSLSPTSVTPFTQYRCLYYIYYLEPWNLAHLRYFAIFALFDVQTNDWRSRPLPRKPMVCASINSQKYKYNTKQYTTQCRNKTMNKNKNEKLPFGNQIKSNTKK